MSARDDGAVSGPWKLEALSRLDKARKRCIHDGDDFERCLGTILDTAIFVTAADKGKLQLLDPISGCLTVRAQRGFDQSLLDYYSYVHEESDVSCGAALRKARRVIVEDVATSQICGKRAREVLLGAGVRAVQSTPLLDRAGRVIGTLCTHFSRPTYLGEPELGLMNILAQHAREYLLRREAQTRLGR
jgi:GAF domain-containing protein